MPQEPESQFMAHWQPLLNMVSLISDQRIKKAIQRWINQNQNCAYSVKTGLCQMNCTECANDITIERVLIIPPSGKAKLKKGV